MSSKKFSEAMSELDNKYVDEAINYEKKAKKPRWIKLGVMVACVCLVIVAVVSTPYMLESNEDEGGGTPISPNSGHNIPEITPILLAQQEIIEEMKKDLVGQDIPSWTETPSATLNFAYVIPIYHTGNMAESSNTIRETLIFDNRYMIPAISNGECIGAFTVVQHEGKWTVGVYESGLDIETEIEKNENSATCFISVSQLSGEYGFLTITDTKEQYAPVPGFGSLDIMSGKQLLEKLKGSAQTNHNNDDNG